MGRIKRNFNQRNEPKTKPTKPSFGPSEDTSKKKTKATADRPPPLKKRKKR